MYVSRYAGILFLAALFSLYGASAVHSAPSITSFSGVATHGSSISITGSGFGNKVPAAPLMWANLEGGTITSIPGLSTGTLSSSYVEMTTVNQPPGSSFSVRGIPWDGTTKRDNRLFVNTSPAEYDRFFMSFRRYYDHPTFFSGQVNYKSLRIWPECSSGATDFVMTYLDGKLCSTVVGVTSTVPTLGGTIGFPPVQTWLTEEYQVYKGTPYNVDAKLKAWINGILVANETFQGFKDTLPITLWKCFTIDNLWSIVNTPVGAYLYLDDLYVDITWARVMVCDQPTFDACIHREIQIPTAWSDTSITVVLNQGSLSDITYAYLYVVDQDGAVNASGYPLDPGRPAAPTGLTVR